MSTIYLHYSKLRCSKQNKFIRCLYTNLIYSSAGYRIKFKLTPKPESEQRHFCWCCLHGQIKDWPPNVWNIYETRVHTHALHQTRTHTHIHTPLRDVKRFTDRQNKTVCHSIVGNSWSSTSCKSATHVTTPSITPTQKRTQPDMTHKKGVE